MALPAGEDQRILPQFDNGKDLFLAVPEALKGFDHNPP
jgi:hypothetical protein